MSEPTKNQQNSNALPNFMSENGKTSYIEENETPNWLANNLHRLMIWVSIIWFGIVLIYISQFFGWSNLFLMMPDEFGAFWPVSRCLWQLSGWLWPILTGERISKTKPDFSGPI